MSLLHHPPRPRTPSGGLLDMKRLLAKPAPPPYYAPRYHSSGSDIDSDGHDTAPASHSTSSVDIHAHGALFGTPPSKIDSPQKRTRNVLRRRPSTTSTGSGHPHPPSSFSSKTPPTTTHTTSSRTSSTSRSASVTPGYGLAGDEPRAHGVRAENEYPDPADGSRQRHRHTPERHSSTTSSTGANASTTRLTPARALAEAYKRQEEERTSTPTQHEARGAQEEEAATPYYTIVGSSSSRIRIPSLERPWPAYPMPYPPTDPTFPYPTTTTTTTISSSPTQAKPGLVRTLSRKVSGKWRRGSGAGVEEDTAHGRRHGRASLQGTEREPREGMAARMSLRVSIEKYAEVSVGADMSAPRDSVLRRGEDRETPPRPAKSAGSASSTSGSGSTTTSPSTASTPHTPYTPNTPHKLWTLVKRLSTTSLRAHAQAQGQEDPPPPVPALPKSFAGAPTSRSTSTHASPSGSVPASPSSGGGGGYAVRPSSTSASTHHRPPPATPAATPPPPSSSSSSPNSKHSRLFGGGGARGRPASSPESSVDGHPHAHPYPRPDSERMGEAQAKAAPGKVLVAQHIIPPRELAYCISREEDARARAALAVDTRVCVHTEVFRGDGAGEGEEGGRGADDDDWMSLARYTPAAELMPLPLPPRVRPPPARAHDPDGGAWAADDGPGEGDRASPVIPAFSTTDPINTFGPRRPRDPHPAPAPAPAPPPRPLRSTKRPSTAQPATALSPGHQQGHARRRSWLGAPKAPASPGAGAKLTEREKDARWADLLERSARAGGTLHLGFGREGLLREGGGGGEEEF